MTLKWKGLLKAENERCFERVPTLWVRKFPPKSFCFLTSPTSPFLPDLCGKALSGCRWGWCQGDVKRRHHPKTSFLLKYLTNYKTSVIKNQSKMDPKSKNWVENGRFDAENIPLRWFSWRFGAKFGLFWVQFQLICVCVWDFCNIITLFVFFCILNNNNDSAPLRN